MRRLTAPVLIALAPLAVFACSDGDSPKAAAATTEIGPEDYVKGDEGKADSSALATVLDFEFDGELVTDSTWDQRRTVQDQLLYTIGHLNGNTSVGRLDKLDLTNLKTESTPEGKTKLTYHAKMPVAWGSKTNLPTTYTFTLPRDVSYAGTEAFTEKYKGSCVETGAHEVDSGSMWYYFRPSKAGCTLADADVVRLPVKVTVSTTNTTGKYPEYHKVWEDSAFNVVAVFGKYEDGATTASDAGITAYNTFVSAIKTELKSSNLVTTPATVPSSPGVAAPDVEFRATLADGKTVQVNALLVDNVASAPATFYQRYEGLSARADFIVYNGHAGLGQNVRALAKRGKWVTGQYLMLFMNGCDTYAYVDGSLAQTRAALNPDDPTGTKYMEIITNAMPAYFASDSNATMAMIRGLLAYSAPRNYERIFKDIDSHQIVLVTGEEDNVYVPGYPNAGGSGGDAGTAPSEWTGLTDAGTVAKAEEKRWETPQLPAGSYAFKMTGTGDADLYVRIGTAPTTELYDCRPYRAGSKESCVVKITTPAAVQVMVRGYATTSNYTLAGAPSP